MLNEWLEHCADRYLQFILDTEALDSGMDRTCDQCQAAGDILGCLDCLHHQALCRDCLLLSHQKLPSHRFKQWTGTHFARVESNTIGYVFHLGHGGHPCTLGRNRIFSLGDVNGIHKITIRVCHCPGRGSAAAQLLRARIYPCSDQRPESGFTYNVLKDFHLSFTEAKVSTQRYFNVLVRHTNNAFPARVDDRYREFTRVCRQWAYLHDLKHSGRLTNVAQNTFDGDLALRCPACPRLNFNYLPHEVNPSTRCAILNPMYLHNSLSAKTSVCSACELRR